jgi:hypothetical protein
MNKHMSAPQKKTKYFIFYPIARKDHTSFEKFGEWRLAGNCFCSVKYSMQIFLKWSVSMKWIAKTGFLACLFLASIAQASDQEVKIELKLRCPESMELQALRDVIPSDKADSQDWDENFIAVMKKTIELVESGKVANRLYTADVGDAPSDDF